VKFAHDRQPFEALRPANLLPELLELFATLAVEADVEPDPVTGDVRACGEDDDMGLEGGAVLCDDGVLGDALDWRVAQVNVGPVQGREPPGVERGALASERCR